MVIPIYIYLNLSIDVNIIRLTIGSTDLTTTYIVQIRILSCLIFILPYPPLTLFVHQFVCMCPYLYAIVLAVRC